MPPFAIGDLKYEFGLKLGEPGAVLLPLVEVPPKMSQKRIVSSAPAETIVLPSGERAM